MSSSDVSLVDRVDRLATLVVGACASSFLAAAMALTGVAYGVHHSNSELRKSVAKSNQTLACSVKAQYDRAEKSLPSNPYYKAHPDQLDAALEVIVTQREAAILTWGVCRSQPA